MMAPSLFISVLLSIVAVIISSEQITGTSDGFFAHTGKALPIDAGGNLPMVCGVDRSAERPWSYVQAYWLLDLGDGSLVKLKPWDRSITSEIPQYDIREDYIDGLYMATLTLLKVVKQHERLTFHCVVNWGYLHKVYTMKLKGNIKQSSAVHWKEKINYATHIKYEERKL